MTTTVRTLTSLLSIVTLSIGLAAGITSSAAAQSATTKDCSVSTPIKDRPVLRSGDRGTCVTVAQGMLANTKAFNGTYTRNFGTATKAAVLKVQKDAKIAQDGVIGQATWNVLAKTSPATQRSATAARTAAVAPIPASCPKTTARSICITVYNDNDTRAWLYAIENQKLRHSFEVYASDGRNGNEATKAGNFTITGKKATVSGNSADSSFLNLSNGTAIHYSRDFYQKGFDAAAGSPNGDVHVGSKQNADWLYNYWAKAKSGNTAGTRVTIVR